MEKYIPDIYQMSIYKINYDKLKKNGIKCLLFDLDNTLIPPHKKDVSPKLKGLINDLKSKGFDIYIFSNSFKRRVKKIAVKLDLKYYAFARKPNKKNFIKLMTDNIYELSEVAIIGDQLLTDILGGNKVGITTILVNPISIKDGLFTKFNRSKEKSKLNKLRRLNLFTKGKYYE